MFEIKLKEILDKKKMSIARLHELTGISQNTLGLIANGKNKGIQFETLEKIMDALDIELKDILVHYSSVNNIYALAINNNYSTLQENEKRKIRYQFYNLTDEGNNEFLFDLSFNFHYFYSENTLSLGSKKLHLFISYFSSNNSKLPENINLTHKLNKYYEDRSGLNILAFLIVDDILKNFLNSFDLKHPILSATVDFFGFERDNPLLLEVQVPIYNKKKRKSLSESTATPDNFLPFYPYLTNKFSNIKEIIYQEDIPYIRVFY